MRRYGFVLQVACLGFATLFLLAIARVVFGLAYADRIYPGVQVAGVDVGGLTIAAAEERLAERFRTFEGRTLTLQGVDVRIQLTPRDLGFAPDPHHLAGEAYRFGRGGSPLAVALGPAVAKSQAENVALCRTPCGPANESSFRSNPLVDITKLTLLVDSLAAQIDRPARDASLVTEPEIAIQPEQNGRILDRDQSRRLLWSALGQLRDEPIDLPVAMARPSVVAGELTTLRDQARAIVTRQLSLVDGDREWPIPTSVMRSALSISGSPPNLSLAEDPFRSFLENASRQGSRAPRNASIVVVSGQIVVDEDQPGRTLDSKATMAAIRSAILAASSDPSPTGQVSTVRISAAWTAVDAATRATALEPVATDAQAAIDRGLALIAGGEQYAITPSELGDVLVFGPVDGAGWKVALDEGKLGNIVHRLNRGYEHPEPRARFSFADGKLKLMAPVEPARSIDEPRAVRAIVDGWRRGEVKLPVVESTPTFDDAFLARAGQDLRGVIEEAVTSYAGSIPDRAHNVELAARNIDGTLLAPGASFSFDDAVGPTTLDAGFHWGFAIQSNGNVPTTVPSVAGGICQVATTLFQPVFWTGYSIDERHWHDYWIEKYRTRGYPGLDATVDPEAGLDLKFTNDSGSYLLIHSWTDGGALHVALIGTRPTWRVDVSPARVTDHVVAPTEIARTTSASFPKGSTIVTQSREDGFRVAIDRRVDYPNGQSRTLNVREQYAPAQTAILVGAG